MAATVDVRTRQWVVTEFLTAEGNKPGDIFERLSRVYGESTVDPASVRVWANRLLRKPQKNGIEPVHSNLSGIFQPIQNGNRHILNASPPLPNNNSLFNNGHGGINHGYINGFSDSGTASSGGNREVVGVAVGQAGVQIAGALWELLCLEHGIHPGDGARLEDTPFDDGSVDPCFWETSKGKMVPRTVLADLEPSVVDGMKRYFPDLFHPDCMYKHKEDAASNFARGRYTVGRSALEGAMTSIRRQAEACSALQGFVFTHSFGGGTGSGFMTLLLERLAQDYPSVPILRFCVFPSPRMSTAVVEPYNAILHAAATMDNDNCAFVFDNEATFNLCFNKLEIQRPTYHDLNTRVAQVIASATASIRFPSKLNVDMADFSTNLVPSKRLHFPVMTYSPVVSPDVIRYHQQSVSDMTSDSFDPSAQMATYNQENGKYMPCCLIYRGDVTHSEALTSLNAVTEKSKVKFVEWCPKKFKVGLSTTRPSIPNGKYPITLPRSVCAFANTTALKDSWIKLGEKFKAMFDKRAFVHWYTGEGLEESEFYEAQESLEQLIQDYREAEGEANTSTDDIMEM